MQDSKNDRVVVRPFSRQHEGTEVVIGLVDDANFLALPPDAVEILDDLASGSTIGEAHEHYQQRYGTQADIEGLLDALEAEGFVKWRGEASTAEPLPTPTVVRTREKSKRYHFSGFPRPLAQAIFSRTSFIIWSVVLGLAFAAVVSNPSIVPGWSALFFPERFASKLLILIVFATGQIALHELSHLIAARALGVSVRFGIGRRLWLLVAETDMSGVWAHPARKRYIPILAGPMLDLMSLSIVLLFLYGNSLGYYTIPTYWMDIVNVMVIVYIYQLLWQCFFFVRTDFYYVITNFFGCKSLMHDTETFLSNRWTKWTGRGESVDQSHIPAHEMRVVRSYSVAWIVGRILAFCLLFFVQMPILLQYLGEAWVNVVLIANGQTVSTPEILKQMWVILIFTIGMGLFSHALLRGLLRRVKRENKEKAEQKGKENVVTSGNGPSGRQTAIAGRMEPADTELQSR